MPRTKKSETVAAETSNTPSRSRSTVKKSETIVTKPKTNSRFNLKNYFQALRGNIINNRQKYSKYLIVIGVVVLLGIFAFWKKDWFVVAVVNREPITSIEYYQNLKDNSQPRSGQQVLEDLIRDKIILQEARQKNVLVTSEEIDTQYKEFEDQYGGAEGLKTVIEQYNMSEADLREQIKMELIVKKILADEIKVSETEIDQFIKASPTDPNVAGTDDKKGPNRDAIKKTLEQNKLTEKSQTWYNNLKTNSQILNFLFETK